VILESLHLINFKNFEELALEAGAGFHFITGPNGAGKTNLLDGIYYLALTRSFLQSAERDLVHKGKTFMRLEARIQDGAQKDQYEVKSKPPQVREWILNGKKYERLTDHIGRIPIVLLAPDDVYLLMNSAEARRKYLSQILVQSDPAFLSHSLQYGQYLKQKNAALKEMSKQGRADEGLLDALDHGMVPHAAYMVNARRFLIEAINPIIKIYLNTISNGNQSGHLIYVPDIEDQFAQKLRNARTRDVLLGRSTRGPHKDKVDAWMDQSLIYSMGSQGQLKTMVAAMKIAQFQYMTTVMKHQPIVLLDDIFAKLDAERVKQLIQLLEQNEVSQCFITDTHLERAQNLANDLSTPGRVYKLNHNLLQIC